MKKIIYFIASISSCFCYSESAKSNFSSHGEIDEMVEDLLKLMEVPGVAIGVISHGEVILSKGYGTRNRDIGLPVTPKTLFPIGSPTKAFTAFLIGILQEEGVCRFDDPVSNHIPYFKLKDPHTTYEITLRDYLTHVSGYPRHEAIWFNETFSRESIIKRLRFLDPIYRLREKFLYQNLGYMIVGHAAETAMGKNFETLVYEKILQPLGMSETTFSIEEMQKKDNFSLGYKETTPMSFVNPETIAPAGGMNSSVDDLLKWVRLLLNQGDGLISPQTFRELITPQVVSDLLCNGRYGLENEIIMESYGLGWILLSYRNHFAVFHGGNIDGFSSSLLFFPREQVGIVVLCNQHLSPFPGILSTLLADKFLHLPFIDWSKKYKDLADYTQEEFVKNQKATPSTIQKNTRPSHPLSSYSGTYTHPGYGTLTISLAKDQLIASFNHVTLPLQHTNYEVFEVSKEASYHVVSGVKFTFQENCYGDIAALLIPLEPQGDPIVFMKEKDSILFDPSYLAKFAGNYSYLGFSFVIEHINDKLVAKAFGQPPFELYPERDNLFKVKGFDNYIVQFLLKDTGDISAVQLTQPNNSTYTAYRK